MMDDKVVILRYVGYKYDVEFHDVIAVEYDKNFHGDIVAITIKNRTILGNNDVNTNTERAWKTVIPWEQIQTFYTHLYRTIEGKDR
jgi:hypothetical protein